MSDRARRLLEAELTRVQQRIDEKPPWWRYGRRAWLDGVRSARAVSETALWGVLGAVTENETTRAAEDALGDLVTCTGDLLASMEGMHGAMKRITATHRTLLSLVEGGQGDR